MTAADVAPILASLTGLLMVLLQAWNTWRINQVHSATNSMKDALVSTSTKEAHAAGKAEGIAEQKAEAALVAKGALSAPPVPPAVAAP